MNPKKYITVWVLVLTLVLIAGKAVQAQAPSLTYTGYTGPITYTVQTSINTLTPVNSGGAIIASAQTSTFAGSGSAGYNDGSGTSASFNQPLGATVDPSGNIYVADAGSHLIRKISPSGTVITFAGTANTHGFTDGQGTAAQFYHPVGLAADKQGNIYVADEDNNAIRKITPSGLVSTLAGGTQGPNDGTGNAAQFYYPCGVAVDASGNVYVADNNNNKIRKVTPVGVVTTLAGGTQGTQDGTGSAAQFYFPFAITIDASGNLYVADRYNQKIRKVTQGGAVTTIAGTGAAGFADGAATTAAMFKYPSGIATDAAGNIYVADEQNNNIRITNAGVVYTAAGSTTGTAGSASGAGTSATFSSPFGLAADNNGNVYVGDYGTNLIRKIAMTYYSVSPALPAGLVLNPTTGTISGLPTVVSPATNYTVTAHSSSGSGSVTLNIAVQPVLNSNSIGFVQQENIKVPNITTDAQISSLLVTQKQTTRTYIDGLGRNMQAVGMQASPAKNDLIQPVAYDNLGRQTTSYLPYAGQSTDQMGSYRPNAITTDQPTFYNKTGQYLIPTDGNPYSQQVFENSPLQRLLKSGMVGNGFQPVGGTGTQHFKTINHRFNNSGDGNIVIWNPDGTFTLNNYYGANSLEVTDGTDEDGAETLSFTDMTGQVILKRQILSGSNLDTYYIYNMSGAISYVVPPAATALLVANSYNLAVAPLSNLVFNFVYDNMGRLVQKTVPAKGTLSIVYDPLNRPVLMQDANMAGNHQWNYVKYDAKGRVINQGIYTDNTYTTPAAMQTHVNSLLSSYNTTWYESRTAASSFNYYTNAVFPNSNVSSLAFAYYDDYDVTNTGSPILYKNQNLTGEAGATAAAVKGMPTVVSQQTVGSGVAGNIWLSKVVFYDKRGNLIQTQSNNQLYYSNIFTLTDCATTVPDFTGVPQITLISKQTSSTVTTSVQTNISYDHMYRVTAVDQYYNGSSTVNHIAVYSYNELGQRIQKGLGQVATGSIPSDITTATYGPTTLVASNSITLNSGFTVPAGSTLNAFIASSNYLQTVDYRYNIRGQLLSINNSKLTADGGVTCSGSNDQFGMVMLYDKTDANLVSTPSYTGRISAVKWMSSNGAGGTSYERAFSYYYDQLGRDTAAIYAERAATSNSTFTITHGWDENQITYDQNGNIKTLHRNAATQGTGNHVAIDNLTYTYSGTNANQLSSVADGSGSNQGFMGGSGTYTYDNNGNLTNEPYKGIATIGYDVLNKTDKITFSVSTNRYIDYTYDASGHLLRKRQYDNVNGSAALQYTTDYIDGFVYQTAGTGTPVLQYFPMPEGRVVNNAGTFVPTYSIADQQGNARVEFDNTGSGENLRLRQENSYYAFGLIMPGTAVSAISNPNKNLYNGGSEWQNDFGNLPDYYQTFFRNYDAALGRWVGVDPKAESAESMTTYQYAGNNPVMFNDPLGDVSQGLHDEFNPGWYHSYSTNLNYGYTYHPPGYNNPDVPNGDTTPASPSSMTDQQLLEAAKNGDPAAIEEYGRRNGTNLKWNPFAGGEISQAQWVALGGDASKLDPSRTYSYSPGGWVVANQGGGVKVYNETDGVGHTYIEVNGTVFSYGRYGGGSSPVLGHADPVGPGVLLKLGSDYAAKRMSKYPTDVYNFPEANANDVYNYLNNLYNGGKPISTKEGPGMVVGTYILGINDCTTVVMSGLRAGGVLMPAIVSPFQFNDYMNPNSHEQDIHFNLMY